LDGGFGYTSTGGKDLVGSADFVLSGKLEYSARQMMYCLTLEQQM